MAASAGSVVRTALPAEGRTAGGSGGGNDAEEVAAYVGDFRRKVRAPPPTFVPDPPPERPVGGLGLFADETVREYKRAYEDVSGGGGRGNGGRGAVWSSCRLLELESKVSRALGGLERFYLSVLRLGAGWGTGV